MLKRFCNVCGEETELTGVRHIHERIIFNNVPLQVFITVSGVNENEGMSDGDICGNCARSAVAVALGLPIPS